MTIQRMIELLQIEHECMLRGAHDACDRNCAVCELVQDDGDLHEMYTDVIALLKEQEPRLLGLEEVKAIALRETKRIQSSEVEPVWLEQNEDGLANMKLALISWWYMEGIDEDETEFEFIAKYFGTDFDDTLRYLDYGTRWRVWSSKPTIEQRKAVKWDE